MKCLLTNQLTFFIHMLFTCGLSRTVCAYFLFFLTDCTTEGERGLESRKNVDADTAHSVYRLLELPSMPDYLAQLPYIVGGGGGGGGIVTRLSLCQQQRHVFEVIMLWRCDSLSSRWFRTLKARGRFCRVAPAASLTGRPCTSTVSNNTGPPGVFFAPFPSLC